MLFTTLPHRLFLLCLHLLLLTLIGSSCQATDSYESRYQECMAQTTTTEFNIEGSTKKGVAISGFHTECLVNAQLPSFKVKDLNGKEIQTADLRGKITVINFWFIKCAPCLAEIPDLNALVKKYDQDVNFLAFSKDSGEEVESFLKNNTFLFDHIFDARSTIEESFRLIWGYPSTIVVDREGRIVEIFKGAKLKSDSSVKVTTAVDALLTTLL